MRCKIGDLQNKQVVCVADGAFLGYIGDIEIDTSTGKITALIILGKTKALGILGREDDLVIPYEEIAVIGSDTILVECGSLPAVSKFLNSNNS